MKDGPDISHIAALIGDPARANILTALMDGRALTASELAVGAGVALPTASGHLAKLVEADLIRPRKEGRHKYFQLAGSDVADVLEARGANVKTFWHPGGHEVPQSELAAIKAHASEISAQIAGSDNLLNLNHISS